jgi:hypothetical protein
MVCREDVRRTAAVRASRQRPELHEATIEAAWGWWPELLGAEETKVVGMLGRKRRNIWARELAAFLGLGVRWSSLSLVPARAV